MSKTYNLKKLIGLCKSEMFFDDYYSVDDYKYWVESYVEINKPDYIAVLELGNANTPIAYSCNFNLEFPATSNASVYEIISAIDEDYLHRIYEIDKLCFRFFETNSFIAELPLFQLRLEASLIPNQPITLLREVVFIPDRSRNKYLNVFLVAFTNITSLDSIYTVPKIDIKHYTQDQNQLNKIEKFKNRLTSILLGKKMLTERERQVLNLVAEGMSSSEIATHLKISVNTVNAHRQNLIRKFSVKNINALISMI